MVATTRRALFGGAVAVATGAAAPALAAPHPDAALIKLYAEYKEADAVSEEASRREDEVTTKYMNLRGEYPATLRFKNMDYAVFNDQRGSAATAHKSLSIVVDTMRDLRGKADGPLVQQARHRCAELIAAHREWKTRCRIARRATGLTSAVDLAWDMVNHREQIERQIMNTPAKTITGLAIKATIAYRFARHITDQDEYGEHWFKAVVVDAMAIGDAQ